MLRQAVNFKKTIKEAINIRNNNNLDMYILAIFNCTIYILF